MYMKTCKLTFKPKRGPPKTLYLMLNNDSFSDPVATGGAGGVHQQVVGLHGQAAPGTAGTGCQIMMKETCNDATLSSIIVCVLLSCSSRPRVQID